MEREISSGAMLGIVLLALAAVIGLGFGIFAIAKGVANEGTVGVQDSLGSVSAQAFLDYDQKIVTGTQAVSALKTFEGKAAAVLIGTKAVNSSQTISADRSSTDLAYIVGANGWKYINYNAVLAKDSGGALPTAQVSPKGAITTADAILTVNNGTFKTKFGYALTDGEVTFDNATGGIFKSGNAEYIPSSTKFQANLIKDASGATIGIALKQI